MADDTSGGPDPGLDPGPGGDRVADALDLVIETESAMSALAATQYARIDAMRQAALADAAAHGHPLTEVIERSIRLELASALRITEAAAGDLIVQATALVDRYPSVWSSLSAARMTRCHAVVLVGALDAIEPEFRAELLPRAVELAEALPVGSFRRQLRIAVEQVRAVSLTQRYGEAVLTRRVAIEQAGDGMAWLHAFLPAVEANAIHGRVTAIAKAIRSVPGEERTLDQVRADVLGDLLIDGTTDSLTPEARGIRATVVVTVPALALIEGEDAVAQGATATVEGIGPIAMARARELCGGSTGWMRVLTHPETGMVLSVGRTRYRPPPELARLVKWRAEVCMGPGCNVPASRCQIDHNLAWEEGGHTCLENHAPFCQGHHTVKHHGRWHVEQIPGSGGAVLWTSPAGRRYRVDPERRVPTFTPNARPEREASGAAPF